MQVLPESVTRAIEALSDLPGIGSRSAERLVFSLLQNKSDLDQKIGQAITELKTNLHECPISCNWCTGEYCPITQDMTRDMQMLCVVETPLDLLAIERTHEYRGQYHVLHGIISPLRKVKPEDLRLVQLFERIQKNPEIEEIIIALSGTTEADATGYYIIENLKPFFTGKITQLARGIPSGGDLDYLDAGTLTRALTERRGV